MDRFSISVPCRVAISNRKYFPLNMNSYRNAHCQVLDEVKKLFTKSVTQVLYPAPFKASIIKVTYTFTPSNNKRMDLMNFMSIVDKFFLDSLVTIGVIPDDSLGYIKYGVPSEKGVDKTLKYHSMLIEVEKIA